MRQSKKIALSAMLCALGVAVMAIGVIAPVLDMTVAAICSLIVVLAFVVYSFAIPEQKQYWRDIASESLVAYARLEHFEKYTEELIEVHHKIENIDETDDFSFIINDSIIYYSIEEFQQPTARDKYHEWKDAEQQYLSEQAQLAELREAYIIADDDTKKELTPTILRLENNQSQLLKRCQNLLSEIRAIELKAR